MQVVKKPYEYCMYSHLLTPELLVS